MLPLVLVTVREQSAICWKLRCILHYSSFETDAAVLYRRIMSGSDNVRGADNQQERLWICGWIAGFVDGEGSFSVPIFRNHQTTLHWQAQPQFVVAQSASSRDALEELVSIFGCGKVYVNQRHDDHREQLALYSVKRFADLRDIIVPFFQEHQLRTSKRENSTSS